ncbi:MAG: molecular chaperone DnaJ [Dehalococcoidales bacterium]|nr:molecular chaperone DnaJ [Dehalococcoidales bacterium]
MVARSTVKPDYYAVLGVERDADEAAIKKAYRTLAMKYHPDRNPGDPEAVARMKEINEAYAVLSDPEKRRLYDTYGHAGLEGYTQEDIYRGVDFAGLFREFGLGDIFGFGNGIFDSLFGARTSSRKARRGADLRYDLTVTLEDVASGAEKTIELTRSEPCPACHGSGAAPGGLVSCTSCSGSGQIVHERRSGYSLIRQILTCSRCHGSGRIIRQVCKNCQGRGITETKQEIRVRIPAGADSGYTIRLEGCGERGSTGSGDLYIVLHVAEHPRFVRRGDDIYLEHEIPFTIAALGGRVRIAGLTGEMVLEIPEGTQTGTVFRVGQAGLPHLDRHGRGDCYVAVRVVTPQKLSRREKELLEEFARLRQGKDDSGQASS